MATMAPIRTDEPYPDWPPGDGEAIGLARSRQLVRWLQLHLPPLIEEGKQALLSSYPAGEITTRALTVKQISTRVIGQIRYEIPLGSIWCRYGEKSFAEVSVWMRYDGYAEIRPGLGMKP